MSENRDKRLLLISFYRNAEQYDMLTLHEIYQRLYECYGRQYWWPAHSDYEIMVGAILTQNTHWGNVEKALVNLTGMLTPQTLLAMEETELAHHIRPSGYYNQKAAYLKAFTQWFAEYEFDIEKVKRVEGALLRKQLLAIKGIGRETADCMLVYVFAKPFFVIDAYTRRILSRIGYSPVKNYDELRLMFEKQLPADVALFGEYHALLVKLAKQHCQATVQCLGCPLFDGCNTAQL